MWMDLARILFVARPSTGRTIPDEPSCIADQQERSTARGSGVKARWGNAYEVTPAAPPAAPPAPWTRGLHAELGQVHMYCSVALS
jgi:hypothetical protein